MRIRLRLSMHVGGKEKRSSNKRQDSHWRVTRILWLQVTSFLVSRSFGE
jgi:hypothetical protein